MENVDIEMKIMKPISLWWCGAYDVAWISSVMSTFSIHQTMKRIILKAWRLKWNIFKYNDDFETKVKSWW